MAKINQITEVEVDRLRPYGNNAKVHSERQVEQIAASIEEFGFLNPCLIDKELNIIAGHGRVLAAKKLGRETVPCLYIEGLTEEQRRAYILADNRLTELGGWDEEILDQELRGLLAGGFDINLTGFELDLDPSDEDSEKQEAEYNPTLSLPDSRFLICSISAFGTDTEKFIEISLSNEEAAHVLQAVENMTPSEVGDRIRGAINAL